MADECEQLPMNICNHTYKMWCKKDKIEDVKYILEKIQPIIEKVYAKNQMLSFDKILFMTMIEILAKDKNYTISNGTNNNYINQTQADTQHTTTNTHLYNTSLNGNKEEVADNLINDFVKILEYIFSKLNEK